MRAARTGWIFYAIVLLVSFTSGCRSPYYADQGALLGGLTGAGVGAIVGNQVGSTAAGAALGAGVGALSGAAIGNGLDEVEAKNRAMIASHMGRPAPAGAVTTYDVISMTQAGVAPELIVNHIRANGTAAPVTANDLISLQQQNVDTQVISALQLSAAGPPAMAPVVLETRHVPPPVIVEEHYYGPYWGPPRRCYPAPYCPPPRPGVSWGVSVSGR